MPMPALAYWGVLLWMAVFGLLAVLRIRRQVRAPLPEAPAAPGPAEAQNLPVHAHGDTAGPRDSHRTA